MRYFPGAVAAALVLLAGAGTRADDADPVVVRQSENEVRVENGRCAATFTRAMGYALTEITDRGTGAHYQGQLALRLRKRWERQSLRPEALMPSVEWVSQAGQEASLSVVEQHPDRVRVEVRWIHAAAEVSQSYTFRRAVRAIELECLVRAKAPLDFAQLALDFRDLGPRSRFAPDGSRVAGSPSSGRRRPAPALAYAFDPEKRSGLGMVALPVPESTPPRVPYVGHPGGTLEYGFVGSPEGRGENGERVLINCFSRVLTWDPAGQEHRLRARLLVGGEPAEAIRESASILEPSTAADAPPVAIERVRPARLIFRTREPGLATAILRNRTDRPQSVRLVCDLVSGIDERRVVHNARVSLRPGERKEIPVRWPANRREYGFELCARVQVEGAAGGGPKTDTASDTFAVADLSAKVAQMTVANPGWFNRLGMEKWLMPTLRDSYTGIVEYYCWAPSHLYELTPDTEEFHPHTESNSGAYRATLTRTFLKGMIARAHEEGLRVLAELTHMASLETALQHPEEVIHTEDGQPYIYSRKVHDGSDEYAVAVVDYYTPDRVARWADEMAASVRMFGWDGVRFDCGWVPHYGSPDPLYAAEKKEFPSFDHAGRPLRCADPDATGEALARLWRTRMERLCPGFEYHSNYSQPEKEQRKYPRTTRAMAENGGGLLQEDRLGVNRPEMHTWQLWAEALRDNGKGVRENGGHPLVGWMLGGPAVSTRVRHYVAFASGYRMYGSGGSGSIDDPTAQDYRYALRFAEYLYDPGLRYLPLDQAEVQVSPDERVLWKPFVYRRSLAGGKTEFVVDLVNLPESDEVLWHHDPPTPKRDIRVSVAVPPGQRLTGAWALLPEPEPRAVPLQANTQDGRVTVTLPELLSMAIVVTRFGK